MALDNQERRAETAPSSSGGVSIPVEGVDAARPSSVLDTVSGKLNQTRSSLENLLNNSPVPAAPEISQKYERFDIVDEAPDPRQPKPRKPNRDDMNARLSRLSKPDEDGK